MSEVTRDHFKESFDGIFEHLANGGEGGKVNDRLSLVILSVGVTG